MRIFRDFNDIEAAARGAIVAIGNFDGVHLGHVKVIETAAAAARAAGAPCGVLTFEPHPRQFFQPAIGPFRLTPFRAKVRRLAELGVDVLFSLRFGAGMAAVPATAFIVHMLVAGLGVGGVVVGPDFAFGKGRRGNVETLSRYAAKLGFSLTEVATVGGGGKTYSSTRVRSLIQGAQFGEAGLILGRLWEVEGHVRHGDRRGHELGFPTANLGLDGYLNPGSGIYAVWAGIADENGTRWHAAAAYVGTRATFGGGAMRLEVHLLDHDEDLYGKRLRVAFAKRLRDDQEFDGAESLGRQIAADCEQARQALANPRFQRLAARSSAA